MKRSLTCAGTIAEFMIARIILSSYRVIISSLIIDSRYFTIFTLTLIRSIMFFYLHLGAASNTKTLMSTASKNS